MDLGGGGSWNGHGTNWEVGFKLGNGKWEMQNREVEEVGCGKGNGKRDVELEGEGGRVGSAFGFGLCKERGGR